MRALLFALALLLSILIGAGGAPLALPPTVVELKGTVIGVSGTDVRIRVDGDLLPQVGNLVRLSFAIPGGRSLLVGTWRVQGIEDGIVVAAVVEATGQPAVDQLATISSPNPLPRAASAAAGAARPLPAPGGASPRGGTLAPGPTQPSRTAAAQGVDITQRQLPSGKLASGDGFTELSPGRFVMASSAGLYTWYALATEAATDYRVSLKLKVEKGPGPEHVAGVVLVQSLESFKSDLAPGDVFFGKNWQGPLLARSEGKGSWTDLAPSPGAGPTRAEDLDHFEVVSRAGRYEFRLNGRLVAAWAREVARPEWVVVHSGRGSRTELRDWSVERLSRP